MLYNKNNVRKTNDKKILHKVGKQWKVISVALLMAIGGGAVATHAANAQSNNGVNANTSAEVAALETKPAVQSAQSVAPSSAASSSASAKPASAVSYLSGDNGSAASLHAKAMNEKSTAASNGAVVKNYVNSLNSRFSGVTSILNGRTASASANAKSDASLANSYSVVAKNSDNKAGMNSLAAKSGLTPSDFASNVAWNVENVYAPAVKNASATQSALNLASGLAEKFMGVNFDDLTAEASANDAVASANSAVASAKANAGALTNASASVSNNNKDLANATVASIEASGENAAMALTQSSDNSLVNSYAKSANVNASAVSSEVQTYAKSAVKSADYTTFFSGNSADVNARNFYSNSNYAFSNANSAAVAPTEALNGVVSNAAHMYAANSVAAKANSVIASAVAAKPSLSANLVSAKSASNANSALVASANAAYVIAGDVNKAASTVAHSLGSNSSADNKASVAVQLLKDPSIVKDNFNNINKSNAYEAADIASLASAYGVDLVALKSAEPALKSLASNVPNGLNNASAVSSYASSVASSVVTDYTKATQSSASYSNATDENVTLASYFASSYSSDASSEAVVASNDANEADAFYNSNIANPKFTAADAAYKAAKAAEPNDAALAVAFGQRVFNYAPKYVRALKNALIHNNTDYVKGSTVAKVNVGDQFQVLGVGFADNGATRYLVGHTKKGEPEYLTANPAFTMNTYLPSENGVAVTFNKTAKVYAEANSKKFTGKTVKAGTTLPNVNVVSLDGIYGGFTNIETPSGNFITANTAYVNVNEAKSANKQATNNVNEVSFWN